MTVPHLFGNESGFIKRNFLDDNFSSISNSVPLVSVLNYGAIADGNPSTGTGTDNSAAFTSAISYANANSLAVYVPSGVYILRSQVSVPSNVRLYGDGMYRTFLIAPNTFNGNGLLIANGAGGPPTIIENLCILGQTSTGAGATSTGINAAANAVILHHIWCGGFLVQFRLSGTDVHATDVWADVSLASGYGFVIDNGGNTLTDFVAFNCYIGVYVASAGYWSTTQPELGVTIINGDIIQCGLSGVTLDTALNTSVTDLKIQAGTATSQFTRDFITINNGSNINIENIACNFGGSVSLSNIGIRQTGSSYNLELSSISIQGAQTGYQINDMPFGSIVGCRARLCGRWGFEILGNSAALLMSNNQSMLNGGGQAGGYGAYRLSNSPSSGAWVISCNSGGDLGASSQYGMVITADSTASSKINLIGNGISGTATKYLLNGTVANITQTANV